MYVTFLFINVTFLTLFLVLCCHAETNAGQGSADVDAARPTGTRRGTTDLRGSFTRRRHLVHTDLQNSEPYPRMQQKTTPDGLSSQDRPPFFYVARRNSGPVARDSGSVLW
jgi:hypothetical protein